MRIILLEIYHTISPSFYSIWLTLTAFVYKFHRLGRNWYLCPLRVSMFVNPMEQSISLSWSFAVKIISRVTFKSRDFLAREMYAGNTIELTWPSVWSSILKCISTTNTNIEKIKITRFECDTIYGLNYTVDKSCAFKSLLLIQFSFSPVPKAVRLAMFAILYAVNGQWFHTKTLTPLQVSKYFVLHWTVDTTKSLRIQI